MERPTEPDLADLFHRRSSFGRAETTTGPDPDHRPPPHRRYPGAPRMALGGADDPIAGSFAQVVAERRSARTFTSAPLTRRDLGRLLWSSAAVRGLAQLEGEWYQTRPTPSAGALHPLELFLGAPRVEGLAPGRYHYDPQAHELERLGDGPDQGALSEAAFGQPALEGGALVLAFLCVPTRSMWKYGQRGYRFLLLEAGHLAHQLCLAAGALGVGSLLVGGFVDEEVHRLFGLAEGDLALCLIALGRVEGPGPDRR
jgi:SagB-type dehydrogenase family enzyme